MWYSLYSTPHLDQKLTDTFKFKQYLFSCCRVYLAKQLYEELISNFEFKVLTIKQLSVFNGKKAWCLQILFQSYWNYILCKLVGSRQKQPVSTNKAFYLFFIFINYDKYSIYIIFSMTSFIRSDIPKTLWHQLHWTIFSVDMFCHLRGSILA